MIKGKIIKAISGFFYVECDNGIIECKARGILRKKNITPIIGDNVIISTTDLNCGIIEEVMPRKTELVRPPVANIDKVFITFAVKEPNPNLSLLDRFIVFSEKMGLDIVILLSKVDLDENLEKTTIIVDEYSKVGYKVIPVSIVTGQNMDKVKQEMKGYTSVFAGQSGVGKSSIINSIVPELDLETSEISHKLGRGKHTTRHAQLFKIDEDTIFADTPGFSSFEINDVEEDELKHYFIEFSGLGECRFGNKCIHKNEPDCVVKEAVENNEISKRRYESYLQILEEIKSYNSFGRKNREKDGIYVKSKNRKDNGR